MTRTDNKRPAIIVDLDGTLALFNGREPFEFEKCDTDLLNEPVATTVFALAMRDVLIVTGRYERVRTQTEAWLDLHGIPYDALFMRRDGDNRKDADVKREIYYAEIADRYDVLLVLDDRNQSVEGWRQLGLVCFQVAEGNF